MLSCTLPQEPTNRYSMAPCLRFTTAGKLTVRCRLLIFTSPNWRIPGLISFTVVSLRFVRDEAAFVSAPPDGGWAFKQSALQQKLHNRKDIRRSPFAMSLSNHAFGRCQTLEPG